MTNDDNVIDAEVVEVVETANLPAVVETHRHSDPIAKWSEEWWALASPEVQSHRCVAHKKSGERCRNAAISGATVCRYHGGAAPHVKRAARARIDNAMDLMAKQLLSIALTAESDAVKLAAVRDALDRGGLKPPTEVFVSQGEPKPWETVFDTIGGTPGGETPSVPLDYQPAGVDAPIPPAPAYAQESMYAGGFAEAGEDESPAAEDDQGSVPDDPPPSPRPSRRDRDGADQPPTRHITGEAAMRAANWANRAMAESHGLPWGESDRRRR